MPTHRITTNEARTKFAQITSAAEYGSTVTVCTRHGRAAYAIVPLIAVRPEFLADKVASEAGKESHE